MVWRDSRRISLLRTTAEPDALGPSTALRDGFQRNQLALIRMISSRWDLHPLGAPTPSARLA